MRYYYVNKENGCLYDMPNPAEDGNMQEISEEEYKRIITEMQGDVEGEA